MFRTKLVGVGHRPIEAQALVLDLEIGTTLDLEAEPENPFDSNAIKVLIDGEHVGYIAASERSAPGFDHASVIAPHLPARAVVGDGAGSKSPVLVIFLDHEEADEAGPTAA